MSFNKVSNEGPQMLFNIQHTEKTVAASGICTHGMPVFSQVMDDLKKTENLATCPK